MNQQRSKEWFDERLGRFTASEIHKLLGVQGLGETGKTYCFEKAVELVFGKEEEEGYISEDIRRGIELEPLAFNKFKELKTLEFLEVKEAFFFPYKDYAGASPDGLVSSDAILEIKCPRHLKFLNLVVKGAPVIDKSYFSQMQMQMLCSNSQKAYFFNYIVWKGKEYWNELIIERDEKHIDLIKKRMIEAKEIRDQFVTDINKKLSL